jgi:hypothetical protein
MPGSKRKIDFVRLIDWLEGRLPGEEARAVEEQLAVADSATLEDVAWLRTFFKVSEETVLQSPPPEVRNALVDRFAAYAEGRRSPGLLQRFVASLRFDSGLQPAAGLRAAGTQEGQKQLIYSTDVGDVALNVLPRASDKNLDLDGQVLPTRDDDVEPGFFSVQLLQGGTEVDITATDDLGNFAFESIPPGAYDMLLSTDQYEIVVAPVELGE